MTWWWALLIVTVYIIIAITTYVACIVLTYSRDYKNGCGCSSTEKWCEYNEDVVAAAVFLGVIWIVTLPMLLIAHWVSKLTHYLMERVSKHV